jgi:hypothetical protein
MFAETMIKFNFFMRIYCAALVLGTLAIAAVMVLK